MRSRAAERRRAVAGPDDQRPGGEPGRLHRQRQQPVRPQAVVRRASGLAVGRGDHRLGEPERLGRQGPGRRGQPRRAGRLGQRDRATGQVEQLPHGSRHAGQGGVQVARRDQALRQGVQGQRLLLAPLGLAAAPLAGGDQRAHHHRDQQVGRQRHVRVPPAHAQRAVRRDEQHVEGEEPEGGGDQAGREPPGRRGGDHHHQEREHHDDLVDAAAEGQQDDRGGGGAEHGDRVPERRPPPPHARAPPGGHALSIDPGKRNLCNFFARTVPIFAATSRPLRTVASGDRRGRERRRQA